jgi:transglutaminase-like putative cysteine protease
MRGRRRSLSLTAALDSVPRQRKYLYLFSFGAGLIALQLLYLGLDDMLLNLWLSLALGAGFVYSYFIDVRYRTFTEYWVSAAAALISVFYYLQIQRHPDLLGNYLGILAGILIVLLAFKAFAPGDHRFIMLLECVVLIFAAVISFDLKFMLLLPVYLVVAFSTLYISNQVEVASRVAESHGEMPQVVTVGRTYYRVLWRAVLGMLGLSIIAYVLTPHASRGERSLVFNNAPAVESEGEQNAQSENQQVKQEKSDPTGDVEVGIGNEFDLTDGRRLTADPRPALQVKTHRNGYLRAQVYDYYTGTGWFPSAKMEELQNLNANNLAVSFSPAVDQADPNSYHVPLQDFPSEAAAERLRQRGEAYIRNNNIFSLAESDLNYETIRQEVTLLEAHPPHYFAMYQPAQLLNISESQGGRPLNHPVVDPGGAVHADGENTDNWHPRRFTYTVVSLEPRYNANLLRQVAVPGPDPIVTHYTQLPDDKGPDAKTVKRLELKPGTAGWRPISQRMRNFARQVVAERVRAKEGATVTPYQKVQAVYEYLTDNSEFRYTRDYQDIDLTREMTEEFCLVTQEGYCRQFASAMAVLCRLNGVPARVVTGYAPGGYSLIENAYLYKASNAHAWVEVYFDGYGWIMFDPSPASGDVFNKNDIISAVTGTLDFLSQLFVLDPAATQRLILDALLSLWQTLVSYGPLTIGFLAVATVLIVLGIRWARRPRKRRAGAPPPPENAVIAAYITVRDQLARLGLRPGPGQTARGYLTEAGESAQSLREQLTQLIPLYERAAFARGASGPEDENTAQSIALYVRQFVGEEVQRRRRERKR